MGKQGMISIIKDGNVITKIISGCNGNNTEIVVKEIIQYMSHGGDPECLEDIYRISEEKDMGCIDCLIVMSKDKFLYKGLEDISNLYKEEFEDPKFNPRWECGIAGILFIIPVIS